MENFTASFLPLERSALPGSVEPLQKDRFRNISKLRAFGAHVSHHLRPILRGINDDSASLGKALEASHDRSDAICLDGLRPDRGIQLLWTHSRGLDSKLLPKTVGKDLPSNAREVVRAWLSQRRSALPLFERSSEAISFFLGRPDYNLYKFRPNDEEVFLSVPPQAEARVMAQFKMSIADLVRRFASNLKIPVNVTTQGQHIILSRKLSYQEHRLLIHAIGHSGNMDVAFEDSDVD